MTFINTIHVDTLDISTTPNKVIFAITDESRMFSVATIITDSNAASTVTALQEYWFK